jgi:hypothetical protein
LNWLSAGASAIEKILKRHPNIGVVVFSVWEPILPTDWRPRGSRALRRLSDQRVHQFWDFDHHVAAALKTTASTLQPNCCEHNGILWDVAAVYAPGPQWQEVMPVPVFLDGAVSPVATKLEAAMSKVQAQALNTSGDSIQ